MRAPCGWPTWANKGEWCPYVRVSSTFCVVAERAGRVETRRSIPQNKKTTSAHELGERAAEDGERAPHIPVRLEVAERPRIEQAAEEDAKEEQYRGDRLVGGMLLLYGGYFAFRRTLPAIEGNWTLVEAGIGFVGGVLGAMAGLSGALPSMWLALRPWPKAVQRGIMQPFSMVILLVATVLLALKGVFTPQVLYNLALVLPASMFGAVIGLMLFRRMADALYPRVLIGLMLIAGGTLLARTMLAGGA